MARSKPKTSATTTSNAYPAAATATSAVTSKTASPSAPPTPTASLNAARLDIVQPPTFALAARWTKTTATFLKNA